jgi:hypothetical protein
MAPRFAIGTTIRISTETVNYDDTLTTPDGTGGPAGIQVTITKGSTEILALTTMTESATGKHFYRWQSATDLTSGKYQAKFVAWNGGYRSIEDDEQAFYLY